MGSSPAARRGLGPSGLWEHPDLCTRRDKSDIMRAGTLGTGLRDLDEIKPQPKAALGTPTSVTPGSYLCLLLLGETVTFNVKIKNPALPARTGDDRRAWEERCDGQRHRGRALGGACPPAWALLLPRPWLAVTGVEPRTGHTSAVTLGGHPQAPWTIGLMSVWSSARPASTGQRRPAGQSERPASLGEPRRPPGGPPRSGSLQRQ